MGAHSTLAFLAGIVVGIGLALFGIFLVAQVGPLTVTGLARPALGLVGMVLIVAGFAWMARVRANSKP